MDPSVVERMLAASFLAGEPNAPQISARASVALGKSWKWLDGLAERYVAWADGRTRPRLEEVVGFLREDQGFRNAYVVRYKRLKIAQWEIEPQRMLPVAAARSWPIPAIESTGELAKWLQLTPNDLDWFADLKNLVHKRDRPRLDHYRYRILFKSNGNIRLIEAPKPRLKALQRRILSDILDRIPPHRAVHGFVRGRSIKTFVAPHTGKRVILRMDLRDFFPSIRARRIQALFRTMGYPESVADLLGGISTNATPRRLWKPVPSEVDRASWREARELYSRPHLPQGAPASPALANLCAYRVDCRLTGLAKTAGAVYTRYADDLAFSGGEDFDGRVEGFSTHVARILEEEGFPVHHRKTRIMRQGVRQHLAGIVANQHANVMRTDFDRLKAILTNCVRLGPESQNRDAHPQFRLHLEGRVAFVEMINPARGSRLRQIFGRIEW